MRRSTILLTALLTCLLLGIAGCPMVQIAHPVLVHTDTFGFEPKWSDKSVVFVQVLTKDHSAEAKEVDLPALIGPCSDATAADIKDLAPFMTVWAIRALNQIPAKALFLTPGQVPDGFEQIIPTGSEKFIPVHGEEYYVLACLEPVDDRFYSLGIRWTPGQASDLLGQTEIIDVEGPFRHSPSGMVFPIKIRGFRRSVIRRYDSEGYDIGVGYDFPSIFHPIAATVYVYPSLDANEGSTNIVTLPASAELARKHFEGAKRALLSVHENVRIVEQAEVSLVQSDETYQGRKAVFEYEDFLADLKQPVRAHLYVFCHPTRNWVIKYRFTHPQGVDASDKINEFMENLRWTIENSQPISAQDRGR